MSAPRLTSEQYDEIEERLCRGEALRAIALDYGIKTHTLRARLRQMGRRHSHKRFGLTPTQQRVWTMRLAGASLKQIAAEIGCAVGTVVVHCGAARRRLGVPLYERWRLDPLSQAERRVFDLHEAGIPRASIAEQIGRTTNYVATMLSKVRAKAARTAAQVAK